MLVAAFLQSGEAFERSINVLVVAVKHIDAVHVVIQRRTVPSVLTVVRSSVELVLYIVHHTLACCQSNPCQSDIIVGLDLDAVAVYHAEIPHRSGIAIQCYCLVQLDSLSHIAVYAVTFII